MLNMRDVDKRVKYASGAFAHTSYGCLRVAVPNERHHSITRARARKLARSVWGPKAEILEKLSLVHAKDCFGGSRVLTMYSVVIVGSSDDYSDAMIYAENTFDIID